MPGGRLGLLEPATVARQNTQHRRERERGREGGREKCQDRETRIVCQCQRDKGGAPIAPVSLCPPRGQGEGLRLIELSLNGRRKFLALLHRSRAVPGDPSQGLDLRTDVLREEGSTAFAQLPLEGAELRLEPSRKRGEARSSVPRSMH